MTVLELLVVAFLLEALSTLIAVLAVVLFGVSLRNA